MFNIPPINVCKKYTAEIREIEKEFLLDINSLRFFCLETDLLKGYDHKPSKSNFKVAIFFPYWFAEKYNVSKDQKQLIVLSGIYYSEYLLMQDFLMDNLKQKGTKKKGTLLILANLFLLKSMTILRTLFSSQSSFWKMYDQYMLEYWNVLAWEKKFCSHIRQWKQENIEMLGKKLSPLKISAYAFYNITGSDHKTKQKIEGLERIIEYFHIGMQILDDIDDCKEDILNRHYTYFISQCVCSTGYNKIAKSRKIIEDVIYNKSQNVLVHIIETSITYLKKSESIAKEMNIGSLATFLSILIESILNLKVLSESYPEFILNKGTRNLLLTDRKIDELFVERRKYL